MTTEKTTEFSGKCPCGKGAIEVDCCSVDNGYRVYPDYYETRVACAACEALYGIEKVGRGFHLVHKADLDKVKIKNDEYHRAAQKLLADAETMGIMSKFAELLDSQPSAAARHRLVTRGGLERSAIATFRNRWRNGKAYVQIIGSGYNVGKILSIIRNTDPALSADMARLESLGQEARARPAVVGQPFHTID